MDAARFELLSISKRLSYIQDVIHEIIEDGSASHDISNNEIVKLTPIFPLSFF